VSAGAAYFVGGVIVWLLFAAAACALCMAGTKAEREAVGWDEWDDEPTVAPSLRVLVFDDHGVHHGALNADDSITVLAPYDQEADDAA